MTTQLTAYSYSYNPITGGTSSIPWVYNYVSDITISDSNTYYYNWQNSLGATIPSVYVVIVGEGGLSAQKSSGSEEDIGGTGGSGGGQVTLLQFTNVQPADAIQINYNEALGNNSYCYLSYLRNGESQNLTQIGAYYYNTPNYETGTNLSTISFSNNLWAPIPVGYLVVNNNTCLNIFYGGEGSFGSGGAVSSQNGGNGGTGGGGSGGGGGQYTYAGVAGSNGSRGTQNYNLETYGGMKGGTSDSSDCRDGGYTPLCMPDGTGTSSLPAGALLGNAGSGNCGSDSGTSSAGESGAPGSIMVFYPTN